MQTFVHVHLRNQEVKKASLIFMNNTLFLCHANTCETITTFMIRDLTDVYVGRQIFPLVLTDAKLDERCFSLRGKNTTLHLEFESYQFAEKWLNQIKAAVSDLGLILDVAEYFENNTQPGLSKMLDKEDLKELRS
jgi:hypothetical protein